MPADQSRLLFLQLVALEKDYLFGQNDRQIYVNIGNSQQPVKITAEGKRARWEKIGQQMVQAGGIHYLGKSYDELRMIYYDLRRRTTEKLKKIGEKEGEEGAKKNLKLNERDLVVLEIIGKNSLGPTVRENLNLNEEMSTSRMANSPNSFATGKQSSIMKNETGIEEEEEEMGQFEGRMEEGGGIMGENGAMEGEEEGEGMMGKRMGNTGRKRKRRRGEEEEGEGGRMGAGMMSMNSGEQFEMLVGQAKLNYFNSQMNLAESKRRLCEEQRALAKAQRTESELRAELLRMDIQRARANNAQKATNNQK